MDAIKKVDQICKKILALSDDDISAVKKMQEEQSAYVNPLKMAKQAQHNNNGEYNKRVIAHLEALRNVIKAG